MISIKNLTKTYKNKKVLNNININFDHNINFLIGNNGAGKTTLINVLAGIVKPTSGSIFINDKQLNYMDGTYKKDIGFLLSLPTYPYQLKINEYIALLNSIYSINVSANSPYQKELLSFFELDDYLNHKISELSTGYIKRVKLLAAMLHKPNIYIFDEPFSGLDKNFIPLLFKKINILSKQGDYFLITSHLLQIQTFNFHKSANYEILNGKIVNMDSICPQQPISLQKF